MRITIALLLAASLAASCASSRKQMVVRRDPSPPLKVFSNIVVEAPAEQTEDDVTVVVRPVLHPERIQVVDPDGQEQIRDTFSPYAHPGVVDTAVFAVTVINNGREMAEVPPADRILVGRSTGETQGAIGPHELQRKWREYCTRITYNSVDWPDTLERERCRQAILYLNRTILKGGTVPPGGRLSGYLPIRATFMSTGAWTITFPRFKGSASRFPEFRFTVQVS